MREAEARAEVFREWPVTLRRSDGVLLDGVVDMLFRERDAQGKTSLTVVDFKTDVVLTDLSAYQAQLAMYCEALQSIFQEPCRAVLFRV